MKVKKNINNNVSVCLDRNGNEVIVFGKGVGFTKPPYEIDESRIDKVYYGISEAYISMFNAIPENILAASDRIISYAQTKISNPLNPNTIITLADHIQFAVKRYSKNIAIELPIAIDIKHMYKAETDVGRYALKLLSTEAGIKLPEEEAVYIAMHIINAEIISGGGSAKNATDVINDIVDIIETYFDFEVDKDGFNYSRFVSHMHYLLKRVKEGTLIEEKNSKLYASLVDDWQQIYACCNKICEYLQDTMKKELTDEERLYLMLHIDRLLEKNSDA